MAQSEWVARQLRATGHAVRLLELVTSGDRWSATGAAETTKGLFVKELEEALLDGRADLAVHSAKDLPGELPAGLGILAVPAREDARDVLVGATGLDALRPGARVGTGSPRRAAQLRHHRPDVAITEIRGNVGTRLDRLAAGEFDALVLAAAGLARLGIAPTTSATLAADVCVPAPGQGALAIEVCTDRLEIVEPLATLNDPSAASAVAVERAFLSALGGGCREPVGIHGVATTTGIDVRIFAANAEGTRSHQRTCTVTGPDDPLIPAVAAELSAALSTA
jgi:hydroxymethylbilane synthase